MIKNITVKMSEDEHYKIKLAATLQKMTLQEFVLSAIFNELEKFGLEELEEKKGGCKSK